MRTREATDTRIQFVVGTTSDQERTEEVLERMVITMFRRRGGFQHETAGKARCAVARHHWQNSDWIDGRRRDGDSDTRLGRRS